MKCKLIALLLLPASAFAFTSAETQALKAAALAEPSIQQCLLDGNDGCVADWYNAASSFIVWKTSVNKDTITASDAFAWDRVDNLTTGKARIWSEMFDNQSRTINPSKANIRAGIDATWVGTAADLAVRAAAYAQCKRPATNAQKVLATGTGTDASPGILTFQGTVSPSDVAKILRGN